MKKTIKKIVTRIINSNSFFAVAIYMLLLFYRKAKYRKYKYKYDTDGGMVLFDMSDDRDGQIKMVYEKMLYDEYYSGLQFVIALKDRKLESKHFKDTATIFINKKSIGFLKYSAKAKYWFKNGKIDLHVTPKREQVLVVANADDVLSGRFSNKCLNNYRINKKKKYLNKYFYY